MFKAEVDKQPDLEGFQSALTPEKWVSLIGSKPSEVHWQRELHQRIKRSCVCLMLRL